MRNKVYLFIFYLPRHNVNLQTKLHPQQIYKQQKVRQTKTWVRSRAGLSLPHSCDKFLNLLRKVRPSFREN